MARNDLRQIKMDGILLLYWKEDAEYDITYHTPQTLFHVPPFSRARKLATHVTP